MKTVRETIRSGLIVLAALIIALAINPASSAADDKADWDKLVNEAGSLFEQEQYQEAVTKATEAVQFAESRFGLESPMTINSIYLLGTYYSDLGYPQEAAQLFQQALNLAVSAQGGEDITAYIIMEGLAESYGQLGLYSEALQYQEKVLAFKQQNYGELDPETVSAMAYLAKLHEVIGEFAEAEKYYQQAILLYEQTIGPEHEETLYAKENLASVYKTTGRFEEAKALIDEVYSTKLEVFGEDHFETAVTTSIKAELLHKTGAYTDAEPLYLKAISTLEETVGTMDPEVFMVKGKLAQLYQDLGEYSRAEPLFLAVYEFEKELYGENHPNCIIDLNNLAGLYRLKGEYAKSEEAYVKALGLIRGALGEKHPETISIMNNLALLYENQGLFDNAEPLFKTALAYSEESLGEKHPTTLALMNNLASLYESQGVFERSEPLYNKAMQLNIEVYGPDHANTLANINNLGYLYLMQEEYDQAQPLFELVYESWRRQLGEKHQNTLKSLNNLARVYHRQGKTDKAETMFLTALNLRREVLGEKHPDVVRSMVDLGALYTTKKDYARAETTLLDALALSEEALGDKHQYTFEAINNLAKLYELQGETDKALEIMQKGFNRRTQFFERVLWAAGENTRQAYVELHRHEQDRFLNLLLKTNTTDSARMALNASLQRKGLLLKITSEIHRILELTNLPELSEKAKALDDKRKQLASLTLSGPTTQTPQQFRELIIRLENELEELQAELGRASMIYHIASQPVKVDDVFANLDVADVLVDYMVFNDGKTDKVFAVVVRTDTKKCFVWWNCVGNKINLVPLGELEPIRRSIQIFRETIQDEEAEEEDILETGYDTYTRVWKPLNPYLGNKRSVYIVPDSALYLLPFDAMVNENDNFLIQSRDLKILSSSRDLAVSALPDAQGKFVIFAGPDYDMDELARQKKKQIMAQRRSGVDRGLRISHGLRSLSFEPLYGAEIEGKTIKQVSDKFAALPGAVEEGQEIKSVAQESEGDSVIYLNREAEEEKLRSFSSSPQMIHIATHGFFLKAEERLKRRLLSLQRGGMMTTPPPGDNPLLRAGLAFAGINSNAPFLGEIDTDNDGVLTALEVLSLNLSGTRLVVLSACETGVGEIHAGEGVYGLRRAFQEAGVKSVVNSLWPVSDEGTRRLMTDFYRNMFEGMQAREALKAAKIKMLNSEWFSPYYWASFVLVERRFSSNL